MTCLIIDDNPLACEIAKHLVVSHGQLELIGVFNSAMEAFTEINKNKVELLLLDIEMPVMNGFELLKTLSKRPIVIVTSGKEKYALQSYDLNVADYLLKPLRPERFALAIEKAFKMMEASNHVVEVQQSNFIFIKDRAIIKKIKGEEVLWIEAQGDYVKIHTHETSHMVHATMKSMESKMPVKMVRVHRSYLVALEKIDRIEENLIYINNKAIPVSDAYWEDLKRQLNIL
jgi:two-component system, LytTR family, response regulator